MTKRLLLSLVSVAAVAALVAGGTMALFTDDMRGKGTFTAGTVRLGDTTHYDCELPDLWAPGDEIKCEFKVKYIGTLDAYVGLELEATGKLFELEKGVEFAVPGAIKDAHGVYVLGKYAPDTEIPIEVTMKFPSEADNALQGKAGKVSATLKAVQVRNNEAGSVPKAWN